MTLTLTLMPLLSCSPTKEAETEAPSQRNRHQPEPATNASSAITEGRRVHVGILPYPAKEHKIAAFLSHAGYGVNQTRHLHRTIQRPKATSFVEFDTKDKADQAMTELNGRNFLGRPLKVKPCAPKGQHGDNANGQKLWLWLCA
ncbi:hypothetical protein BDW71DRAFT_69424 [Aspergillus fruticulosus]